MEGGTDDPSGRGQCGRAGEVHKNQRSGDLPMGMTILVHICYITVKLKRKK